MRILKIFLLENKEVIFVVKKSDYEKQILGKHWQILVNNVICKQVENLELFSLLNQSKNLDEIALQAFGYFEDLKNIDLNIDKLELVKI